MYSDFAKLYNSHRTMYSVVANLYNRHRAMYSDIAKQTKGCLFRYGKTIHKEHG